VVALVVPPAVVVDGGAWPPVELPPVAPLFGCGVVSLAFAVVFALLVAETSALVEPRLERKSPKSVVSSVVLYPPNIAAYEASVIAPLA
jgi:hypothetical protein